MLNRRAFLGSLLASIVGTAFVPSELLWVPSPEVGLPPVAPGALLTLEAITQEVARRLAQRISLPVVPSVDGLDGIRLGTEGMTQQLGIDLALLPHDLTETGLDARRYIAPAVASLADRIQHDGWSRFGQLALPGVGHSARYTMDGVSVRGLLAYEPLFDETYLRFDVLGSAA